MKLFRKRKWLVGTCGLVILAATFLCWPFGFGYDSVCDQCGAVKYTREWKLPFIDYTFFTHSFTEQTPLSTYLTSAGIVSQHSHHWLFGHGGGYRVTCALGPGDSIRAAVESPDVVRFLTISREFGDQEENSNFLRYAFDPDISRTVCSIARSVSDNGFASRAEYHAWVTNQDSFIEDAIEFSKINR